MMSSRQAIEEMNYYNDHRVIARERGPVKGFDEKAMTITHIVEECSCAECEAKGPPYYAVHAQYLPCRKSSGPPDKSATGFYVTDGNDYLEHFPPRIGPWPQHSWQKDACQNEMSGMNAASDRANELNRAAGFDDDWVPEPHVIILRACYEVCGTCDGKGSHVNPDIDCGGISGDDPFWEDDYDYDDDWDYCDDDDGPQRQTSRYMRGDYDVACYECGGKRVVPVPRDDNNPDDLKLYYSIRHGDAQYDAVCRAERMMGA